MANLANQNPLTFDTDFASFAAIGLTGQLPVRVRRVVLESNGTTVAGNVLIQDAGSSFTTLEPLAVAAAAGVAGTKIASIDFVIPETWSNFKITGLTATVTKIYLWLE